MGEWPLYCIGTGLANLGGFEKRIWAKFPLPSLFPFCSRIVGVVSDCDEKATEKKDEVGEALLVTTVYLDFLAFELRLAIYGWSGSGGERLAVAQVGQLIELSNIFIANQANEERRRKGDFEYLCFFTTKRGSSMRILNVQQNRKSTSVSLSVLLLISKKFFLF